MGNTMQIYYHLLLPFNWEMMWHLEICSTVNLSFTVNDFDFISEVIADKPDHFKHNTFQCMRQLEAIKVSVLKKICILKNGSSSSVQFPSWGFFLGVSSLCKVNKN